MLEDIFPVTNILTCKWNMYTVFNKPNVFFFFGLLALLIEQLKTWTGNRMRERGSGTAKGPGPGFKPGSERTKPLTWDACAIH